MNWEELTTEEQLEQIREESKHQPVMLFKHSSRCSISSMVLNRLERNWKPDEMPFLKTYFLDLISYRNISNRVAEYFEVEHQSPQVMILRNGRPVYARSHQDISVEGIRENLLAKN